MNSTPSTENVQFSPTPPSPVNPASAETSLRSEIEKASETVNAMKHFVHDVSAFIVALSDLVVVSTAFAATVFSGGLGICLASRLGSFEWFTQYSNAIDRRMLMPRVVSAVNFISHTLNAKTLDLNFRGLTMFWTGNVKYESPLAPRTHTANTSNTIDGIAFKKMAATLERERIDFDSGYHRMVRKDDSFTRIQILNKCIDGLHNYVSFIIEALCNAYVNRMFKKNYITQDMKERVRYDNSLVNDFFCLKWTDPAPTIGGDAKSFVRVVPYDELQEFDFDAYDDHNVYVSRAKSIDEFFNDIYAIWAGSNEELRLWNDAENVVLLCAHLNGQEIKNGVQAALDIRVNLRFKFFRTEMIVSYLALKDRLPTGLISVPSMDLRRMIDLVAFHRFRYYHSGAWRRLDWIEGRWLDHTTAIAPWYTRCAVSWNLLDLERDSFVPIFDHKQLEDYAWYRAGAIGLLTDLAFQVCCGHWLNLHFLGDASNTITTYLSLAINFLLNLEFGAKYGCRMMCRKYNFTAGPSSGDDPFNSPAMPDDRTEIVNGVLDWQRDRSDIGGKEWYEKAIVNELPPNGGLDHVHAGFIIMTRADFTGALGAHFGSILDFGELNLMKQEMVINGFGLRPSSDKHDVSLRNFIWRAIANRTNVSFTLDLIGDTRQVRLARSHQGTNQAPTVFEIPHLLLAGLTNQFNCPQPVASIIFVSSKVMIPGTQGSLALSSTTTGALAYF